MTIPNIITADAFRQRAFRVIYIPGFSEGDEPIAIQIKSTGIMNMLANGKVPNTLLGKVTELFEANSSIQKDSVPSSAITEEQKSEALKKLSNADSGFQDMAELLKVFAANSMVQPSYEEVKDYMTDEQLMAVFSAMYGEAQSLETFRKD